jgi:diguanylate cyclase (GGDEF)-like protein/PAS domain S-box-containing protein
MTWAWGFWTRKPASLTDNLSMNTSPERPLEPAMSIRREWLPLALCAITAACSIALMLVLWGHANERREVMRQLEQLEGMAFAQSALEWRALAENAAHPGIPPTQFQADTARRDLAEQLDALSTLEARGAALNGVLGFSDTRTRLEALVEATNRFQSSVSATFGQISTGVTDMARMGRERGNPNFDALQDAIHQTSDQDAAIAAKAGTAATASTVFALLITLGASVWTLLRLNRVRARRSAELEAERTKTLRESEARFRVLVQNASDLIAVLEPDGTVRYASPAAKPILGLEPDGLIGRAFWTDTLGVQASMDNQLEVHLERSDGEARDLELRVQHLEDHPDLRGVIVNVRDITERKTLERRLYHQALHDPLTDLPNRRLFMNRLESSLENTMGRAAVLFMDLEGLNLVNDSFGHDRGDLVLVEAARRALGCLREEDVLARLGGDELVALLPSVLDESGALEVANRVQAALALPFTVDGQEVFLTVSIGIGMSEAGVSAGDLVRQSGIAMVRAKRVLSRITAFRSEMAEDAPERLKLESDMRRSLEREDFQVYYQPKVDFKSGRIVSLEALVRWQHPERGFVSPAKFIPFAEETGLIEPLGQIVLETACRDAAGWQRPGEEPLVVAVNLSPMQFRNPNLVDEVARTLRRTGLPPAALELEITESAVLGDVNATIEVLNRLKALGVRLAIDDFGTGYSNLGHLQRFPVDVLKIDQSFVRDMHAETEGDAPIVEAVISLARALDLHVVAEGVETAQQADRLRHLGCDQGQGYFFARPQPSASITLLLQKDGQKSEVRSQG